MSTINFPFGVKDTQTLTQKDNKVTVEVNNAGTFAKINKIAANTEVTLEAGDNLKTGAQVIIRTFNVNDETYNIEWKGKVWGTDISGVDNKAHYSTFMYDGEYFVHTGTQVSDRNEAETVSYVTTFTQSGDAELTFSSVNTNVADAGDDYIADAYIEFQNPVPADTTLALTGLDGGPYEVSEATKVIWLSDIFEAHDGDLERAKLNLQGASSTFVITVAGLTADFKSHFRVYNVTSNEVAEQSHQADDEIENPIILGYTDGYVEIDDQS